jgi:hypothetical protein
MEGQDDEPWADPDERLVDEIADWEVGAGWRASEERAPEDADEPVTDEQIRRALVDLLSLDAP